MLLSNRLSIKIFDFGVVENAAGMSVRQTVTLKEGISKENAKKINTFIKGLKLKVQSQIQGEQLRVTGKKIDDLQKIVKTALTSSEKTILIAIYNNQNQRRYIGVKLD